MIFPTSILALLPLQPFVAVGFASPMLALTGVLLASIPIIIHILNRRRYKVHRWAAMEYLMEAMRRNRKRLKFEHWILMVLRCCAVALAGLALARPMGCAQSATGRMLGQSSRLNVIIIDNAASMAWQSNRGDTRTNLDRARKLAGELVQRMTSSHDAICIIPAAEGETSAVSRTPTYDLDAASRNVAQIPQRFSRVDLPAALQQALEVAKENGALVNRRLYIITDSTRHVWQSPASAEAIKRLGPELAGLYQIAHIDVGEKGMVHTSVQDVRVLGNVAMTSMPVDLAAQVRSYGGGSTHSLIWQSGPKMLGLSANLHIDADTPEQTLPQIAFAEEGPAAVTVKLDPPDRLPEDNELSLAIAVRNKVNVLVAEGDRGSTALESPAAFIQLALAPAGEGGNAAGTASPAKVEVVGELDLVNRVLSNEQAVILAAVSRPTPQLARQLKVYVQGGGTLIIFMGEGVNVEAYNQSLLTEGLLPGKILSLATLSEGQEPFRFDFKPQGSLHGLLHVFKGEEKSGLGTTRIWTYARVQPDARLFPQRVLDLVGGDPAITLTQLGSGRIVFFATSADTRWTTLPAKPAFVALLNEILLGTVDPENAWMNLRAGARLDVPRRIAGTNTPRLSDPSGHGLSLEPADASRPASAYVSEPLHRPGLYRLQLDGKTYPIAVRFPQEEADVTRVDAGAIRQALGDVPMEQGEDRLPASVLVDRDKNDFGWPLLVAVMILLASEAFLAMWFRK